MSPRMLWKPNIPRDYSCMWVCHCVSSFKYGIQAANRVPDFPIFFSETWTPPWRTANRLGWTSGGHGYLEQIRVFKGGFSMNRNPPPRVEANASRSLRSASSMVLSNTNRDDRPILMDRTRTSTRAESSACVTLKGCFAKQMRINRARPGNEGPD